MPHGLGHNRPGDHVVEIIDQVIGRVREPVELSRDQICDELASLKTTIEALRAQLHTSAPGDISQTHIPVAKDELDAVIQATSEATNTIMNACEAMMVKTQDGGDGLAAVVEENVVRIFEACTFQDITGQRITKVIKTLKQIDLKVSALLNALGGADAAPPRPTEPEGDGLLNGPQMAGDAISQAEIDRLLSGF